MGVKVQRKFGEVFRRFPSLGISRAKRPREISQKQKKTPHIPLCKAQRKLKGNMTEGQNRFRIFHTFSQFSHFFHNFSPGFDAENKSALFQGFLLLSAVLRVRGRKQNPRQTPVRTKVRSKRFPIVSRVNAARNFTKTKRLHTFHSA